MASALVTTSLTLPKAGDVAGGSALVEYERRAKRELERKQRAVEEDRQRRSERAERRPVLGRVVNALTPPVVITPESQPTQAWKVGAEGERRVAEVLAETTGVDVLHDRLVPGSRANIDHIAIGPAGVFVIDAKKYTGNVELVDKGTLFRHDWRLYVGGRDRTKLVDGVLGQIEVVRHALGDDLSAVPIHGVLCFVGCEWGWVMRPKHLRGVTALWPRALPGHVMSDGAHADTISLAAERLRQTLRPATT